MDTMDLWREGFGLHRGACVCAKKMCVCYLTASRPAALKTVFSKDLVFFSAQTHTHAYIDSHL